MAEIYIQTSTKNPARLKTAKARYMLCATANGQQIQKDGVVCVSNATSKAAALAALSEALGRFNKSSVIKIYISDDYVRNMLIMNMPKRWEDNSWHKIRLNGQLCHEEYWKVIKSRLSSHAVNIAKADEVNDNKTLKEMEWRLNNVRNQ